MDETMVAGRYSAEALRCLARSLFVAAGMEDDKAAVVAEALVTGEMSASVRTVWHCVRNTSTRLNKD